MVTAAFMCDVSDGAPVAFGPVDCANSSQTSIASWAAATFPAVRVEGALGPERISELVTPGGSEISRSTLWTRASIPDLKSYDEHQDAAPGLAPASRANVRPYAAENDVGSMVG
jgi:hypothetical protein